MLERHFQSLAISVILAVSGWVAFTTQGTSVQVATLQVEVENLHYRLDATSQDLYTNRDAERDLEIGEHKIENLERRVQILEEKISS